MTPLAILKAARAAHSDPNMWLQGSTNYCSPIGPCCMAGMLARQFSSTDWHVAAKALNDDLGQELIDWNDAPGRTHAEVLAAYDATIARLTRASGSQGHEGESK